MVHVCAKKHAKISASVKKQISFFSEVHIWQRRLTKIAFLKQYIFFPSNVHDADTISINTSSSNCKKPKYENLLKTRPSPGGCYCSNVEVLVPPVELDGLKIVKRTV
jgi:hypothetical protein